MPDVVMIGIGHNDQSGVRMHEKLASKMMAAFMAFGWASAEAALANPGDHRQPATTSTQKGSAEEDAIFATMAKLAIQLATLTKYTSANGKIQSETRPDGTVGTYLYDRTGRFQAVTYSDGRAITAIYDASGDIQAMLENGTGRKLVFEKNKTNNSDKKDKALRSNFAIQMGISALVEPHRKRIQGGDPVCAGSSPIPCIIEAPAGNGAGH